MANNQLSLKIPMVVSERLKSERVSRSQLKLNLIMNSELVIDNTPKFVCQVKMSPKIWICSDN